MNMYTNKLCCLSSSPELNEECFSLPIRMENCSDYTINSIIIIILEHYLKIIYS